MNGDSGNWKKECIVTPPALIAATPVGATTTLHFDVFSTMRFRNVVLPVPAFPVRNMLVLVCSTNCQASSISLFSSSISFISLFSVF